MRPRRFPAPRACTAGLAAAMAAIFLAPALAQTPAAAGKALFAANCAACHRSDGSGGISFGTVRSADLRAPGLEKTYRGSDSLILRAILQGKDENGDRLHAPMPLWGGRLSTSQARDILAYLKTLGH